jgi:drug/metabolite transporter (DMT)-like permease
MMGDARRHALTEGVTAGVLFGTAAVFVRYAQGTDPYSIVFWRLGIASATLAVASIVFRKSFQSRLVKENVKETILLGLSLGLHFIFFTVSVNDTTILNATVLVNTVPFFSILISAFVFRLKPSGFALAGLVFSFTGVLIIVFAETASTRPLAGVAPSLRGDLEAIAAAFFLALYLSFGEKVRSKSKILTAMLPIYGFAMCIVGIISLITGNAASILQPIPNRILPLIGLGLLPTAIAHTLYFSSLQGLKPFETATMALLEPVGATVLGIAVFHEVPAPVFALGAVLVLIGIFFTVKKRSQNSGRK